MLVRLPAEIQLQEFKQSLADIVDGNDKVFRYCVAKVLLM